MRLASGTVFLPIVMVCMMHTESRNVLDFDDLILLPTLLLQRNEEVRERWQNKIRYLLVDDIRTPTPASMNW